MQKDPRESINALRKRIARGERGGSIEDRAALIYFSDRLDLLSKDYSDYRHLKLLRHCTKMAEEVGGLADTPTNKAATERILRWINSTYENEETNRDYRSAIRVFAKRHEDSNEVPETVDWVPTGTSRDYDPAPNPAEVLTEAEVREMVEAATNERDRALIYVQFDAGLRSGELYDLTVGDISDGKHGPLVRVDGKTGERSVSLVPSDTYINKWLAVHPGRDDPSAYLWSKLNTAERISYQRYLQIFKNNAERAGISKKVTPTNFRRSNTAWMAKNGANNAIIEDRQGRERGSEHVSRYLARFGEEWEDAYASMHGIDVSTSDEDEGPSRIECRRCGETTPAHEPTCAWCGKALDPTSAATLDKARRELRDMMVRSESVSERKTADEALDRLDSDPEFASEIVSLHQSESPSNSSS